MVYVIDYHIVQNGGKENFGEFAKRTSFANILPSQILDLLNSLKPMFSLPKPWNDWFTKVSPVTVLHYMVQLYIRSHLHPTMILLVIQQNFTRIYIAM